jgi:hypothetical protein
MAAGGLAAVASVRRGTHAHSKSRSASETTMRWMERCAEYTPTAGWWVLSPWVQQSAESDPIAGRWVLSPSVSDLALLMAMVALPEDVSLQFLSSCRSIVELASGNCEH